MAISTCSVCQYLWCHNHIKTVLSTVYLSLVPGKHRFVPMFISKPKAIQIFRMHRDLTIFTFIFFLSIRDGELSSLIFVLKFSQN